MGFYEWLSSTPEGSYLLHVPENFVLENANKVESNNISTAVELFSSTSFGSPTSEQERILMDFYGKIHRLYVNTREGRSELYEKYRSGIYGKCPRSLCANFNCLPYFSKERGPEAVIFCPNCSDVYLQPENVNFRGSHFGSEYLRDFLKEYSNIIPQNLPEVFEPRLFGFRFRVR